MSSPHAVTQTPDRGASANNINVNTNLGPATLIVVCVLAAIIGACGLVMGLNLSKQAQMDRDFRDIQTYQKLLERRYMDLEAYAMLNGWKIPGDDRNGPTGNPERMKSRSLPK